MFVPPITLTDGGTRGHVGSVSLSTTLSHFRGQDGDRNLARLLEFPPLPAIKDSVENGESREREREDLKSVAVVLFVETRPVDSTFPAA